MTTPSPLLWHMQSSVLRGFYQSAVVVAASDRDDAVAVAMEAYDRWLAQQIADMGFHPLISESFKEDEGFLVQSASKRVEFLAEIMEKLTEIPQRGMVMVRS